MPDAIQVIHAGSNVGIVISRHTFCIRDSLLVSTSKMIFCHLNLYSILLEGDPPEITGDMEEHRK